MISRLKGILETKNPPFLLIDVNGVGYELIAPLSTIYQLPPINQTVTLLTHLHVREDAHILYGFYEEKERALFRALIKVSGVGPKLALTILSGIDVAQFIHCIEHRDSGPLVKLSGIGKKTAERLIVEMAGKLKSCLEEEFEIAATLLGSKPEQGVSGAVEAKNNTGKDAEQEAVAALVTLGFKPQEASRAVRQAIFSLQSEDDKENKENKEKVIISSQELIRRALKQTA